MSIFVSCDKLFQRVVSKCLIVLQKDLEKSNEQMQKINFALSTILSEAIKILLLVIFFGYIHKLNLFMVCLFALLMLRSFVGGSHRETILGCFFQSLVTFTTIIYLSEKIRLFYLKNIVVIIAMLGICFFSPCISRKRANMYSEARKQKFKVNALCSIIVLYTISEMNGETYVNIILWVFLLQTIELIVVAIVKNIGRRMKHGEQIEKGIE